MSGGYIFDFLDKYAHRYLIKKYPYMPYWLTANAKIQFLRQLSPNTITRISIRDRLCVFNARHAYITVALIDISGTLIAQAKFKFVGKEYLARGNK